MSFIIPEVQCRTTLPGLEAVRRETVKKFGFQCVQFEELSRTPCGDVLQAFGNMDVKFDQRVTNSRNLNITELKKIKLTGISHTS